MLLISALAIDQITKIMAHYYAKQGLFKVIKYLIFLPLGRIRQIFVRFLEDLSQRKIEF